MNPNTLFDDGKPRPNLLGGQFKRREHKPSLLSRIFKMVSIAIFAGFLVVAYAELFFRVMLKYRKQGFVTGCAIYGTMATLWAVKKIRNWINT